MAVFEVLLTHGAERDLSELHRYISGAHSRERADRLLDRLIGVAGDLARLPDRGHVPPELAAVGIREYRQVVTDGYRVIYRVMGERIIIHLIADSRRNMQSLLERRLLAP